MPFSQLRSLYFLAPSSYCFATSRNRSYQSPLVYLVTKVNNADINVFLFPVRMYCSINVNMLSLSISPITPRGSKSHLPFPSAISLTAPELNSLRTPESLSSIVLHLHNDVLY